MNNTKKKILNSNFRSYKEILDEINRLDACYKKQYKKGLTVDLALSSSGDKKNPKLELVANFNEENKNEVEILLNLLHNK